MIKTTETQHHSSTANAPEAPSTSEASFDFDKTGRFDLSPREIDWSTTDLAGFYPTDPNDFQPAHRSPLDEKVSAEAFSRDDNIQRRVGGRALLPDQRPVELTQAMHALADTLPIEATTLVDPNETEGYGTLFPASFLYEQPSNGLKDPNILRAFLRKVRKTKATPAEPTTSRPELAKTPEGAQKLLDDMPEGSSRDFATSQLAMQHMKAGNLTQGEKLAEQIKDEGLRAHTFAYALELMRERNLGHDDEKSLETTVHDLAIDAYQHNDSPRNAHVLNEVVSILPDDAKDDTITDLAKKAHENHGDTIPRQL